ncbi:MAG: ribose-phosphate pyrophosphokinase [Betaproteobacteria bacterium]|nr:ribose-phosphate pyrophosphokinase [Betaproteobacteria bacterium]
MVPVLIAGDAHPALAHDIAKLAGTTLAPAQISAFADGESRIRIEADVRDREVYIVQPTSAPTSRHLMTLALLADAARAAGAARVGALVPYFGYARQDVRNHPGEPRSAQLAARVLRCAGVERIVTLDLHSPALESAFEMPLIHLRADELMLPTIRAWRLSDLSLVSPDAGGVKRAQRYAAALAVPLAVVAKTRPAIDVAATLHVLGEVRDRACVIVDDMASTGGTIAAAAQALLAAGAREVHAVFVHAVMAPGAVERICSSAVGKVVATDSVPTAPDPRVQIVPVAPLFAQALARIAGLGLLEPR